MSVTFLLALLQRNHAEAVFVFVCVCFGGYVCVYVPTSLCIR